MTNQFEGIVINPGSPNDGKKKAAKTPFLRLNETPLEATQPANGARSVPSSKAMKTADYVFVSVHHNGTHHFWVPDGSNVEWAMDTLITTYRRARK